MAKQEEKKSSMIQVEVLKSFYYKDKKNPRKIGDVIDMHETDYRQWKAAERVKLVEKKQADPLDAKDPVKENKKKEDK